jgi:hypothetical protein
MRAATDAKLGVGLAFAAFKATMFVMGDSDKKPPEGGYG